MLTHNTPTRAEHRAHVMEESSIRNGGRERKLRRLAMPLRVAERTPTNATRTKRECNPCTLARLSRTPAYSRSRLQTRQLSSHINGSQRANGRTGLDGLWRPLSTEKHEVERHARPATKVKSHMDLRRKEGVDDDVVTPELGTHVKRRRRRKGRAAR